VAESFSSSAAVAECTSARSAQAGPCIVPSAGLGVSTPAYKWYNVPRTANEIELVVNTLELEVFFEERIR